MQGALGRRLANTLPPSGDGNPGLHQWRRGGRVRGFASGGSASTLDPNGASPLTVARVEQMFNAGTPKNLPDQGAPPPQQGALTSAAPNGGNEDADPDAAEKIRIQNLARNRLAAMQTLYASGAIPPRGGQPGMPAGVTTAPPIPPQPPDQQQAAGQQMSPIDAAIQRNLLRTLNMQQGDPQSAASMQQFVQNMSSFPQLAAAGAILAPTKTGGFAESLGAGFSAAAQTGSAMADKLLQAQWTREYRDQIGQARLDTGLAAIKSADTRSNLAGEQIPVLQARALELQAQAAKMSTQAAVAGAENGRYVYSGNSPDGLPVFYDTRNPNKMVVGDVPLAPKSTDQAKLDQQKAESDRKFAQFQQTEAYQQQLMAMKERTGDFNTAKMIVDDATKRVVGDLTGKTTMDQATADAMRAYGVASGKTPAPVAAAPPAATSATPAPPAKGVPQRPSWAPPNAVPDSRAPSGWTAPYTDPNTGRTGMKAINPPQQGTP